MSISHLRVSLRKLCHHFGFSGVYLVLSTSDPGCASVLVSRAADVTV
jgi:hypothetical protein